MRTTINIDEHVLCAARDRAREQGLTLGAYIERALQGATSAVDRSEPPPIPVFTRGTGLRPGIDPRSNAAIMDALDDGVPTVALR